MKAGLRHVQAASVPRKGSVEVPLCFLLNQRLAPDFRDQWGPGPVAD